MERTAPRWRRSLPLPTAREWWEALRWVLLVFTVLIAIALAGSFAPYEQVVASGHPWLPAKQCSGCALCGMTRSFCALSAGNWQEAAQWNPGGPFLYTVGWLWLAGCVAGAARALTRRK